MRQITRKTHKDVFTNSKVISTIYKWFDNLKVEKPGPGQQPAAIEWEGDDPETSASLAKKRKRALQEEDEDPDYRGTPTSRTTARTTNSSSAVRTRNAPASSQSTPSRPPPPPPPIAQRPSMSSMDNAPAPPRVNPNFGQPSQGGVSPYGYQTSVDPRAYQVSLSSSSHTRPSHNANVTAAQWHLRRSSRSSVQPIRLQCRRFTTASATTRRQPSIVGSAQHVSESEALSSIENCRCGRGMVLRLSIDCRYCRRD